MVKMLRKKARSNQSTNKFSVRFVKLLGNILILVSFTFLFFTFAPVSFQEVKYQGREILRIPVKPQGVLNREFSIIIPKIEASASVVAGVDPYQKDEYLLALKRGVAHAKGSALPGQPGNVYIFAHSTDTFYNVGRYNAVFYLIGKLSVEDKVYIYYKNNKYAYEVTDKKVVQPTDIKYLGRLSDENTLTLQTCYPPGTTLMRLVVIAKEIY